MTGHGVDVKTRLELARTALACPPLARAIKLAEWVGGSRELTAARVLRPAVAVQACQALGIALPRERLRSAKDVAELNQAWEVALAAELIRVTANRASAAPGATGLARVADGTEPLRPDGAERAVLAWLRGAGVSLGFPGDPCAECLTALHVMREAAGPMEMADLAAAVTAGAGPAPGEAGFLPAGSPAAYLCPDCGQPHGASEPGLLGLPGLGDAVDMRMLDLLGHASATVRGLIGFGAAATGPGRTPGGTVALTPLGELLADSVLFTISPPADVPVGEMVEAVAWLPPKVAAAAAGPWLAARAQADAVGELLDFAAEFDGPMLRFVALDLARGVGSEGAPAWRAVARRPGFGAYARQWLVSRGEPVLADERDEAWLLVDAITQAIGELPDGLAPLVLASALRAEAGEAMPKLLAGIAGCGHPRAAAVTRLFTGGPGLLGGADGSWPAVADGARFQLKVTLRGVSKPPVWRRVLVPAELTLGELHEVVVRVMGWGGAHLHVFSDGMFEFGTPDGEFGYQDEDAVELAEVLAEPGDRLSYTYDLGDDWEHDIRLEKILPPDPADAAVLACVGGRGACPPEDCGGAWGYADLKAAIADPSHADHLSLLGRLGLEDPGDFRPADFDPGRANARLRCAPLARQ